MCVDELYWGAQMLTTSYMPEDPLAYRRGSRNKCDPLFLFHEALGHWCPRMWASVSPVVEEGVTAVKQAMAEVALEATCQVSGESWFSMARAPCTLEASLMSYHTGYSLTNKVSMGDLLRSQDHHFR